MSRRPATVRGHRAFAELARASRRASDGIVRVHFVPSDQVDGEPRVAFSVSRRVGTAVVRNRCRRRLRAIVADTADNLNPGAYLVVVGSAVTGLAFDELRKRVIETMRRASEERP